MHDRRFAICNSLREMPESDSRSNPTGRKYSVGFHNHFDRETWRSGRGLMLKPIVRPVQDVLKECLVSSKTARWVPRKSLRCFCDDLLADLSESTDSVSEPQFQECYSGPVPGAKIVRNDLRFWVTILKTQRLPHMASLARVSGGSVSDVAVVNHSTDHLCPKTSRWELVGGGIAMSLPRQLRKPLFVTELPRFEDVPVDVDRCDRVTRLGSSALDLPSSSTARREDARLQLLGKRHNRFTDPVDWRSWRIGACLRTRAGGHRRSERSTPREYRREISLLPKNEPRCHEVGASQSINKEAQHDESIQLRRCTAAGSSPSHRSCKTQAGTSAASVTGHAALASSLALPRRRISTERYVRSYWALSSLPVHECKLLRIRLPVWLQEKWSHFVGCLEYFSQPSKPRNEGRHAAPILANPTSSFAYV